MLPSTGYFKDINCPFYEDGCCDRPYCHFRHSKRDQLIAKLDETTLDTPSTSEHVNKNDITTTKATYNPTPISELSKLQEETTQNNTRKHIPIPYTPFRPTITPRNNGISFNELLSDATYTPGSVKSVDQYSPAGAVTSETAYQPGSVNITEKESYTPSSISVSNINYVPSEISNKQVLNSKRLEYEPLSLSQMNEKHPKDIITVKPKIVYEPTPLSVTIPQFSSDEDEVPEPEKKKQRLSTDSNELSDLDKEFEMLGQILDEEKQENEIEKRVHKTDNKNSKTIKSDKDKKCESKDKDRHRSDRDKKKKSSSSNSSRDKESSRTKDSKSKTSSKSETESVKSSRHSSSKSKHSDKDRDKTNKDQSKTDKERSKENGKHDKKHDKHRSSSKKENDRKKDEKSRNGKDKHRDKESKTKVKTDSEKVISEKNDTISDIDDMIENIDSDEMLDELSDLDEDSINEECKRIFEEYIPTPVIKQNSEVTEISNEASFEYIPSKKRISHTSGLSINVAPKPVARPAFRSNAAKTLAERMAKVREFHSSNTKQETKVDTIRSEPQSSSKIRIAHVPNVSTMLNAKKSIPPAPAKNPLPSTSGTVVQTVRKGSARVAHIPQDKFADRPGVLEPLASKIPANLRSTYLNMMIDECIKIYMNPIDAYARAQHEELNTSKKCSKVPIYKNSAMLTVNRLRKEIQECNGVKKSGYESGNLNKVNHSDILVGKTNSSWSIEKRSKEDQSDQLKGRKFYENISKWILSEEQLQENGFPRPHPSGEKGRAKIYVIDKKKIQPPKGLTRQCCRCRKTYNVNKKGFPVIKEECIYHPNNKYRFRGEVKYQCCSQDASSEGCAIAPSHVFEFVDYENLRGYVRTLPKDTEDFGIYALDCEMCYTTHGLDLTRITVINSNCQVEYETLIRPLHPIIDYNTRYSGITEEQMENVTTTLLEVQATLLHMFSDKTILIGHSLESDFKALKIIHNTVVDTSVVFPHKMGPPYKRALRNLSSEYLKKIIQNSVDGHDSAEDALVCMELIKFKLKEELKLR